MFESVDDDGKRLLFLKTLVWFTAHWFAIFIQLSRFGIVQFLFHF